MPGTKMKLNRLSVPSQDWNDQEIIVTKEYLEDHPDLYIHLQYPIQIGIGQLDVFLNGQRLSEGGGYEEVDEWTIRLDLGTNVNGEPYGLQEGDEIFIRNWINRTYFHQNGNQFLISADRVSYHNPGYPQLTNVKKALDKLLYIPVDITSFFNDVGVVEIGRVITEVNFNWSVNKGIVSQTLNPEIGSLAKNVRNYKLTGVNITSNTIFTLIVSDGEEEDAAQTSINFRHRRWWGVSPLETLTNSEEIKSLGNSELATNYTQTKTFNATGGNYLYFAFPASFSGTPKFMVGGFIAPFHELSQVEYVNDYGYRANYRIFRSANLQNDSSITVEVT